MTKRENDDMKRKGESQRRQQQQNRKSTGRQEKSTKTTRINNNKEATPVHAKAPATTHVMHHCNFHQKDSLQSKCQQNPSNIDQDARFQRQMKKMKEKRRKEEDIKRDETMV